MLIKKVVGLDCLKEVMEIIKELTPENRARLLEATRAARKDERSAKQYLAFLKNIPFEELDLDEQF